MINEHLTFNIERGFPLNLNASFLGPLLGEERETNLPHVGSRFNGVIVMREFSPTLPIINPWNIEHWNI